MSVEVSQPFIGVVFNARSISEPPTLGEVSATEFEPFDACFHF